MGASKQTSPFVWSTARTEVYKSWEVSYFVCNKCVNRTAKGVLFGSVAMALGATVSGLLLGLLLLINEESRYTWLKILTLVLLVLGPVLVIGLLMPSQRAG